MSLRMLAQLLIVGYLALAAEETLAQGVPVAPRAPVMRTPQATQAPVPRGWSSPRPVKPFTNIYRTPTISPYLNLTRDDSLEGGLPNYFALVRPQLQQEAFNRQQQRSLEHLNSEVRTIESRFAVPPGGDPGIRPTGHEVHFMNYSHYFRR